MRAKPLWQDLQGRTIYRVFGALTFDELWGGCPLTTAELLRRLRDQLKRPLSRQTVAAWRRGDQAVPVEVILATGSIVGRTTAEAGLTVMMRLLGDPAVDPEFSRGMRMYYGHDRTDIRIT
jgi:hypothetical protein